MRLVSPALYRLLRPVLFLLEPEAAHRLALNYLGSSLGACRAGKPATPDPILATRLAGLDLPSPLGLAAGCDKDGVAIDGFLQLGFGFVEVGTVTPRPQYGNPRPRLFRLVEDSALINRLGFNNAGLDALVQRLAARGDHLAGHHAGIVGVNVGANKDSADRIEDMVMAARAVAPYAAYVTVNISSPNTPGLRDLQSPPALRDLTQRVRAVLGDTPLFIKVAPDLTQKEIEGIARVALDGGITGLIVSNTTVTRPDHLRSRHAGQGGGLSGAPLAPLSHATLRAFRRLVADKVTLIGVGGISSGADAYARIRAGASAVQLYTGIVYHGPSLPALINAELAALLHRDGFTHITQAIGCDI